MTASRFTILGSSAGKACIGRASSSYLLDLGDTGVLMDCGDGATGNFLAAGHDPEWVSHIVISHTHSDHVCGLPYFIQQRYLSRTDALLTIHCPAESIDMLQRILIFGYLMPEMMPFEIDYKPIEPGTPWEIAEAIFTAYPTAHVGKSREMAAEMGYPNKGQAYAFHVQLGDTGLVYSGDLGSLDDLNPIREPITHLIIETTHPKLDQLWSWAEERSIKVIVLTHISDDFDQSLLAEAAKHTPAEVRCAEDGMILNFP